MSAVGERGQVTIPKAIRDYFGLTKGTRVDFEIANDGIRLRKRAGAEDAFDRLDDYLADRRIIKDIDAYIAESRGR